MDFNYEEFEESTEKILKFMAEKDELRLYLDRNILSECFLLSEATLNKFRLDPRNSSGGKNAGTICYWVQKLKPIYHKEGSPKRQKAVNEMCGVLIAFATINIESDFNNNFLSDLIGSLRQHTHTPHSLALLFESLEGRADGSLK